MRIVHINVTAAFITGRIAVELCRHAMREGHRALLCYARGSCPSDVPGYRIGSTAQTVDSSELTRVTPLEILVTTLTNSAGWPKI